MIWVLAVALGIMLIVAQIYKVQRDKFADEYLAGQRWIDDVITALENRDEVAGNVAIDSLLDRAGK